MSAPTHGQTVQTPCHRLADEAISETLGQGGGKGTRTVAGYDEDTTRTVAGYDEDTASMGVEAARRARWNGAFGPPPDG